MSVSLDKRSPGLYNEEKTYISDEWIGDSQNMDEVSEIKRIYGLKRAWQNIVDEKRGKIYLTYSFHEIVYKCFTRRKLLPPFRVKSKLRYVVYTKDGRESAILPILVNGESRTISFDGLFSAAGYNDLVAYDEIKEEAASAIVSFLHEKYAGYTLELLDICEDSILNSVLDSVPCQECYYLNITDGYDGWYSSVSRNIKDTIHYSQNRIRKEIGSYEFCVKDSLSFFEIWRLHNLYERHLREIFIKGDLGLPRRMKEPFFCLELHLPSFLLVPVFAGIKKMEREHIALVKLNGKVAAMTVYYDEEDGIIIPKCGYDTGFSRYSPGMMNTIEMIKRVPASKMPYKIDLSRGYHSYKVRYGGLQYHNYGIKMTL